MDTWKTMQMFILNCKYFLWEVVFSHVYSELSVLNHQQVLRLHAVCLVDDLLCAK